MKTQTSDSRATATQGDGSPIALGMIGLGTVGSGVYKLLSRQPDLTFATIAVRNLSKSRNLPDMNVGLLTQDPLTVVENPAVQVVIEVMGGVDPARELVTRAIRNGKHVVTANKELIAKYGEELFTLAREHRVRILFEGAVAGGIPIIMPLKLSLAANRIQEIAGIINGTTNYILTKMTDNGWSYEQALGKAQEKGYAEADPTNDVEGFDTKYKIAILSSIAFKQSLRTDQIPCEGISKITARDIQLAVSLGYVIKLIGLCRRIALPSGEEKMDIRVHPMLIPEQHPLASIKNENNAIWIKGDAVGDVMFYGKGAGEMPTASAVCGDVLAITQSLLTGNTPIPSMEMVTTGAASFLPIEETRNRYFVRLNTLDKPGVIGNIGLACGEFGISIDSIVQHGINEDGTASIVLITHEQSERQLRQALDRIRHQDTTEQIACVLRIL